MKNILFVGGGTLGHIFPSFAVAECLPKECDVLFVIGTKKAEVDALTHSEHRCVSLDAPPFPRELSASFFLFPFSFLRAFCRAFFLLRKEHISVIFSKGGYVSVPVCLAAFFQRIPIIWHASDSVLSQSDRLFLPLARVFCTGFPLDVLGLSSVKLARHTGNPVRSFMMHGSKADGYRITGFSEAKPTLLVLGGSQGALSINIALQDMLPTLVEFCQVIHLTGEGKAIPFFHPSYYSSTFSFDDLPHLYSISDVVLSRAGAGGISELASLSKPTILVPLEGVADDHQVKNATVLSDARATLFLSQDALHTVPEILQKLFRDPLQTQHLGEQLHSFFPSNSASTIASILLDVCAGVRVE